MFGTILAILALQSGAVEVPPSRFASPEAHRAMEEQKKAPPEPAFGSDVRALRKYHEKGTDKLLARVREHYATTVVSQTIGGVRTDVVTPNAGLAERNRERVLISLHSGGFMWGGGSESLLEAIPIAAGSRIKVLAIDYRMAPEFKFPAASEDVAAVYRALLKTYKPENIGIYGCSAGGILAAESVAWFVTHNLPRPGAIATLCGTGAELDGDSAYLAPLLAGRPIPAGGKPQLASGLPYFMGVDTHDPLAFPIESPQVLAKFPPTLLLAGSRDFAASSETVMQRRLAQAGVPAQLVLFDGLWHAFMMDPDLPESREVYDTLGRFFDEHLGDAVRCTLEHVRSLAEPALQVESVKHVDPVPPVPAHCAVTGYIERGTRIGFKLGLPDDWNRKYLFYGIGGFAGQLDPIEPGLVRGYATGTGDTGHTGQSVADAAWALNNPVGIVNHFETGTAVAAGALKSLTTAYYASLPTRAYFQGCSAGGRQAIVEAVRFPDMFDGIIAAAPAWNYTQLLVSFIENGKMILRSPANWTSPDLFKEIDRAVLEQCDADDGDALKDGIITDPRRCKVDLRELLCRSAGDSSKCLTRSQLGTLQKLMRADFASGQAGYFGYRLTGSDQDVGFSWGWPKWFFGTLPPVLDQRGQLSFRGDALPEIAERGVGPNQYLLGEQFLRYMLKGNPSFDARTFSFSKDAAELDRTLAGLLDVTHPDLGPFIRKGGKLLIWHGWSDPAIPAEMSIDLYDQIVKHTVRYPGQAPTEGAVKLFLVPGVQHCGGGTGLTQFDPLSALERWTEENTGLDSLQASQVVDGKTTQSRPVCAYPKVAQYRGSGNPADSASFECK